MTDRPAPHPVPAGLALLDASERGAVDLAALPDWRTAEGADALLAAAALWRLGRVTEARAALQRATPPGAGGPLLIAAAALRFELGDFQLALDGLERAAAQADGAAEALNARFTFAGRLGWHRDAVAAAARLLECAPPRPAELHARLQQLLAVEGDLAAALAHLRRRDALEPPSAERAWQAAELCARLGRDDEARAAIDAALALSPADAPSHVRAAQALLDTGAFAAAAAQAEAALHADPRAAAAWRLLAQLRLWHGDAGAALQSAEQALAIEPASAAARRQRGAALLLLGRSEEAMAALEAALAADPGDAEAHTWRAEALWRLGHIDAARAALTAHPLQHDSAYWVAALVLARLDLRAPARDLRQRLKALIGRRASRPTAGLLDAEALTVSHYELSGALRDLAPDAPVVLASRDAARQAALLDAALAALAGNRSARPTHRGADGALAYLPQRAPRDACVRALGLIKTAAPADVLARLDAIIAAYPDSSLPISYRGELRLWLGEYDGARADLDAALAQRATTRWAYYGLALLANVENDPARALALCARSVEVIGDEGPPIFAHRGEALRRVGRTDEARAQLRRACELSPSRLSGRLNLALADGDAGDLAGEAAGYAWLRDQAPGLVGDAAHRLGHDVDWLADAPLPRDMQRALLEEMLVMMRGNRATSFATWLSPAGLIRIAGARTGGPTALDRFRADAEQRWRSLRALLERALVAAPAGRGAG